MLERRHNGITTLHADASQMHDGRDTGQNVAHVIILIKRVHKVKAQNKVDPQRNRKQSDQKISHGQGKYKVVCFGFQLGSCKEGNDDKQVP